MNQIFITENTPSVSNTVGAGLVLASDYDGPVTDVMPTADPSITSDAQRLNQAMLIASRVAASPGLYNSYESELAFLKAIKVTNIDKILPDPKGPNAIPPSVNPKLQIEQLKVQAKQASDQLTLKLGLLKLMGEAELNQAYIQKLESEAQAIKIGVATEGQKMRIQEINSTIALQRERREGVLSSIKTMNTVYDRMMQEQPEQQMQQEQPQMPEQEMPQLPM